MSNLVLTPANYYSLEADNAYWSASLVKEFLDCPARACAELRGEYEKPKTTALLVGGYIDAWFDGDEAYSLFVEQHRDEIFQRNGKPRADFVKADEMIASAVSDPVFMEFMEGDKQVIYVGSIAGFQFKMKADIVHESRTVDVKSVKDFEPVYLPGQGRVSFADAWNWPLQMAIYQEIRAQNENGIKKPCYLAAITKQTPPDKDIIEIEQENMDVELEVLTDKMPLFDAYKQGVIEPPRCEKCAYCRSTRKIAYPTKLNYYRTGEVE